MNFYRNIFLIFITIFIVSCAGDNISHNRVAPYINTNIISNEPLPVEYFIDNYKNEKITIYAETKKEELLNQTTPNLENMRFLSKSDIFNLIGSPVLIKNENNIEIWQYRSELCILNIIWHNNISQTVTVQPNNNSSEPMKDNSVPLPTNELVAYNQDTKNVKIQECAKYFISHK